MGAFAPPDTDEVVVSATPANGWTPPDSDTIVQSATSWQPPNDDTVVKPAPMSDAVKQGFIQAIQTKDKQQAALGQPMAEVQPDGSITQREGQTAEEAEANRQEFGKIAKPFVPIPKFTVNPDDDTFTATGKEAANVLLGVPEFIESPLGIATLGAGAIAPKTVAAVFTGDTLKGLGEQIHTTYQNWDTMTPAQQSAAIVDMTGSAEFATLMGHAAVKGLPSAKPEANDVPAESPLLRPDARTEPWTPPATDAVVNKGGVFVPPDSDEIVKPSSEPAITPAEEPQTVSPPVAEVAPPPPAASAINNVTKLLPVDVSPEHVASMASTVDRGPDVIDDLQNHTSQPVYFDPKQFGNLVADAREQTLTKAGRPSAATKRLDAVMSDKAGVPADEVLTGLAGDGGKYADWTPDDLGAAIIGAHQMRENPPIDLNARAMAETQARDNLFNQANKASRAGVESVPVEQTQIGDTFTVNGNRMTVVDHPVDADTGKVSGVQLEGAYGVQHLPVGSQIHMDAGSLREGEPQPLGMRMGMGAAEGGDFVNSTAIPRGSRGEQHKIPQTKGASFIDLVKQNHEYWKNYRDKSNTPEGMALGARKMAEIEKLHPQLSDQPQFTGMGGAVPKEFEGMVAEPTGIKKAAIARERTARGEQPLPPPEARSFPKEVWQQTLAKVADNPDAPQELVNSLLADQIDGNKRALTDSDIGLLLHRHTELTYDRAKLVREQAMTEDDAKQFPNRADELPRIKGDIAKIDDQLDTLEKAMAPAVTETARGLAALRAMVQDNYSLTRMERVRTREMTTALGRDLTPGEHADMMKELLDLRAKMKDATEREAKAKSVEDEERSKAIADEAIKAQIDQVAKTPGYNPAAQRLADRIVAYWTAQEAKADAALKEMGNRFNSGIDPTFLKHVTTKGIAKIVRFGLDKDTWLKQMVNDFGDKSLPWLNKIWADANKKIEESIARGSSGRIALEVKKRVRKDDVTGNRAQIIAGLKDAANQMRPLDEQGDYIRKLMENFIASGLKEREPLVDAIHKVLTDEIGLSGVSRRDVREAMANYGKFKALNPDEIKATRRDLSHQIAQTLKLEDIQARRPLPKSGVEQHTPSTEGRLLQQQVNEAKRRYGVVTNDPAKQLKSALDARKTWLNNRIADVKFQIANGERTVKTKTPGPWDAETKLLQVKLDDLNRQLDDIAPKPGITDAQRAALAEHGIEREIDLLTKQVAGVESLLPRQRSEVTSARLDALKARRDALRAQRDELRAMDPQYKATLEQRAIKSYLSRLANSAANYADRLARGDFAKRQVKPAAWKTSPEVIKAFRDNEAAKQTFHEGTERALRAARTPAAKVKDSLVAAIRAPFAVAIAYHGTVGMETHAGARMFLPSMWREYWPHFFKQWPMWLNKDYHARAMYDLVNDADYHNWLKAGADIDPRKKYTDTELYASWGKRFLGSAMSQRGFDTLKIYRMAANKAMWDKVAPEIKRDPQAAALARKNIAQLNNHATGVGNLGHGPLTTTAQMVMFAAKLEASRWARIIGDPVKTIYTGFNWSHASEADKMIAKTRVWHAAQFAAVYYAALLANQGMLSALGSNQKVNLTDPTKSDWLKFKAHGYNIMLDGGLLTPVRFLGQVIFGDILGKRTAQQQREDSRRMQFGNRAVKYAQRKLSPQVGLGVDTLFGTDYAGRPMPFSNEPAKYADQPKLTWGEYLWSHGPIPATGAAQEIYSALRDHGMSGLQARDFIKAATVAAAESMGAHVNEDFQPLTPAQAAGVAAEMKAMHLPKGTPPAVRSAIKTSLEKASNGTAPAK